MAVDKSFDVVVIGAGISGLAAARFYLEIHPSCRLAILERDDCVGGTWSSKRNYDHFWTQWAQGYAEFTDLPMKIPPEEDMYCGFFKSKYTTAYLEQYADHHNFAGLSLRDRVRFGFNVKSVTKSDGRWQVSGSDSKAAADVTLTTTKLIIASGLTSVPRMPILPGIESFNGRVIHHMDFGRSDILTSPDIKRITILGGGKSASDMVYAAVKGGKSVTWLVRPGGVGPAFYLPAQGKGPYRGAFDMGSTRLAEYMAQSYFSPDNWFSRFLRGTGWGKKIMDIIWSSTDDDIRKAADYKGREAIGDFHRLEPRSGIFWQNGPGGILNRADLFDVIAKNVEVCYDNISQLDKGIIRLESGKEIQADVLLCGTGWNHSLGYLSEEMRVSLGLPHVPNAESDEARTKWTDLDAKVAKEVVAKFPVLANPPPHFLQQSSHTPYRLYQNIAPLHDNTIAVVGQVLIANYFRATECQAMWATAYLDGKLTLPPLDVRETEIARFLAWDRRRCLSTGQDGHQMTFDMMGYTDNLLKQLGLSSHRKNMFRDIFYPSSVEELRGLKDEYIAKYGKDEK